MATGDGISKKKRVLIAVAIIAVIITCYALYQHFTYVETDNAAVQAHTVMLSPKVSGIVVKVHVEENQKVKAGEVLVEIDNRDFQNSLDQMRGEMESLQAKARDAELSYRRISELFQKGAVSRQQLDTATNLFKEQGRKLNASQAMVKEAQLNVSYAQIRAPTDAVVARKSVEPGMLAAVGQPLVALVETGPRWVVANFKETEIPSIALGKKAYITVDALPGHDYEGSVESISPSTGATFTLLPPDNATGNFTKVVQRVPVRIRFEKLGDEDIELLRAGLSAGVKVRK